MKRSRLSKTMVGGIKKLRMKRVKFTQRFERHKEVIKAVYIPTKLHLTIFYDESFDEKDVKRVVLKEIDRSNLQNSVESLSFYPEMR